MRLRPTRSFTVALCAYCVSERRVPSPRGCWRGGGEGARRAPMPPSSLPKAAELTALDSGLTQERAAALEKLSFSSEPSRTSGSGDLGANQSPGGPLSPHSRASAPARRGHTPLGTRLFGRGGTALGFVISDLARGSASAVGVGSVRSNSTPAQGGATAPGTEGSWRSLSSPWTRLRRRRGSKDGRDARDSRECSARRGRA